MSNYSHKYISAFSLNSFVLTLILLMGGCAKENLDPYVYPENSVKIKELILDCNKSQLSKMAFFWGNLMELDIVASSATGFSVMVGNTKLTFRQNNGGRYQFSIEIPENQIENARLWIQQRTPIVPDAGTGAEILHKSKLNSHSLFFSDPAGNLIELVARHDLKNSQEGDFNKDMMTSIMNISVVTRNVQDCSDLLSNNFQFQGIPGTSNSVRLIGGETGTITLHVPSKPYYPTQDNIAFSYRLVVVVQHPVEQTYKFPGCEASIRSEP